MAHLAEVRDGVVVRVIVAQDRYGDLSAEQWAARTFGGTWLRTSYTSRAGTSTDGDATRKNYAGRGYAYDATRDAFIPPKPYASWVLNETTCLWDAPVSRPTDGREYTWDESRQRWVRV